MMGNLDKSCVRGALGLKGRAKYIQVKMRVKEMKKASISDSRKFTEKGRKELMQ